MDNKWKNQMSQCTDCITTKVKAANKTKMNFTSYPIFELTPSMCCLLARRAIDIAFTWPSIKVILNKIPIRMHNLITYCKLINKNMIYHEIKNHQISIGFSECGFKNLNLINGFVIKIMHLLKF